MSDKVVEGYQLSPQQARIWLLQQVDGSQAYRTQCALQIEGDLEVERLKAAIGGIVARHEILRTSFHLLGGMTTPLQAIEAEAVAELREIDLRDCEGRQKSARFEELLREEGVDCLRYERGPRVRFCLVRMSEAERVLMMSLPAVCADSRSLKNLYREIARSYGAQGRGEENADQPVQYVDFAEWQKERLEQQEDRSERLKGLSWRPGESTELKVGLERERERGARFAPESVLLMLDVEIVRGIERVSGAHRVRPEIFLLACWQVLLWRLSGNKEVTIDSLYEGRSRGKLQEAMGAFASYSAVQCHLEPDYRLDEMLEMVDRSWRAAQVGVDQMLRGERDPGRAGSVERRAGVIGFGYEEWPGAEYEGGVKFSYRRQYCCIDQFRLRLGAYRREEGLEIEMEYDPSIYGRESIELMQERYQRVIESALSGVGGQIVDWEVVGKREQERLIEEWNRTKRRDDEDRSIHELIGEQAGKRGEAIAVAYREEQLSYGELERRAGRLASDLRRKGVGLESVVGLYVERSTEMMIGLLGILKAGGAYLPLEVRHPEERLRMMLEEAGARVVAAKCEEAESLREWGMEVAPLDGESGESMCCGEEEWKVSGENLAYVIYTSGSTGKPKGVMVRHRGVLNLMKGLKEEVYEGKEEGVTVSLNAPLSFDASVKQVAQLANGSRLCIVPEEERLDGREMLEYMRRNGIEVMDCTPSQWRVLKEAELERSGSGVRRALVGGEAIDEESWREMRESREIKYYNVYGPTECTVDATVCQVKENREPTIGRPIRNTRIYILDERGEAAPTGVTGEIYIGGEGLGRGYIGDPWQTAEKFVPDPYVKGGERMYRTGDRGRYVEGGRIEYEGRRDGQVKLRGHRIELGEIEEVLRSYPGVREAVVTVREDDPWQKRLVGYVVGRQEWGAEGKRRRLPNGMVIVEQNKNETEYLYEEIFRKKIYFKHGIGLPEGGCVFDVGANIGLFTLFVSQNRKSARVYAFEPIKPIYETLRINAQLYGGAGVKAYQVGLGEEEGKEWYTYYRGYSMMSGERRYATATEDIEVIKSYLRNEQASVNRKSLLEEADEILSYRFEGEQYECQVRRLTDVIREERIERIDILKVDVQRAEMNVLRGLEEADWKKIDQIVMEVHDQEGNQTEGRLEEIRRLLKAKGYDVTIEQDELLSETDRYNLYAKRLGGEREREGREWVEVMVDETWDEITEDKLRKYVRKRLPDYMAPAAIVVMKEFPLTRNGKIDRGALPKPEELKRQAEAEERERRNAYEEIIDGIWKDVLKFERAGRLDSFFEIGGDSLSATQVIARIRDVFSVEIGVRSIFNDPTIEGLARVIEEASKGGENEPPPPLVKIPREGSLPLSFAQQRLWFIDQLEPGNAAYNCPVAARLKGRLDLDALERVINEIIRRHEVLRTRIEVEAGEPAQVIDAWEPRRLEVLDLTSVPPEKREEEVGRRAREEAATGFDLSRGPLFRVKVLKLQEDEHVALCTMSHIVSDGWSKGILIGELNQLYDAYARREESPLEELTIQYADYAVWQREWMQGEFLEKQLAYWKRQLAGVPSLLQLPTDRPRPAVQSYRGAYERFVLSRELADELKRLSRSENVTMFMVLLAGLQLLLARYSGEGRIAIGAPVAGRNRKETEGLIGFFVNTLVMVADVSGNPTARDLLRQVRGTAIGAFAHQDLPFERLVEELQPERSLSQQPLFQIMFAFQNYPEESLAISGLEVREEGAGLDTINFDLSVTVVEDSGRISGSVGYATDLYDKESVISLLGHLRRLLEGMTADRERRVLDIPLLTEQEREQVLDWNRTAAEYAAGRCLHEVFEEQAGRCPDRVAGADEVAAISYGELNRRANQLGNYLRRRGVGPESRVGICLERGLDMLVGLLGILKAGGAYAPLDPAYPAERLSFMLEDAAIRAIVTQEKLKGVLKWDGLQSVPGMNKDGQIEVRPTQAELISIDGDLGAVAREFEGNIDCGVRGDDLAYVIYTSGSTGRPKGTMVTHQSVVNLATDAVRKFGLERDSKFFQFASISFDVAVEEIFPVLLIGGTVVVQSDNLLYSYSDLTKAIERHEVTTIELPTVYWLEWMRELSRMGRRAPRSLNLVIIGGERISPEILKEWREPQIPLLHVYGLTEVAVTSTVYPISADISADPGFPEIPIGRPMANTEVYLLDDRLQPIPPRIPGEMYLGGVGLARGYLNRPDLTAESFIPNPSGLGNSEPGARMYRTGDLGRFEADGKIEFLGRCDNQVKVRGYRIELGEIEAVLNEHRWVRQSVVVASQDERGGKRLLGYVVGEEGATAAELRRYVRERLPEYMAPETIFILEEMPLTANGKIDRQRLPSPENAGGSADAGYAGARTPVEEIVAGIFERVLKVDRVGRGANFFEIGGHSLLAIQVISRVRSAFGIELGVRSIFERSTVESFSRRIEEAMISGERDESPPLVRASRESQSGVWRPPLSFAQQRLWFLEQLEPGNTLYNIPGSVRLNGEFNLEALGRTINEIFRRHEVLRTRIEMEAGEPVQVIDQWKPRRLEVEDLVGLTREEQEEKISRIEEEEFGTGFDLSLGPMLRVKVLKLGEEDHVLLYTMSHIVSDAWSMDILRREVVTLYQAYSAGDESPLEDLPIQYADFAVWQRNWLQGAALEKRLEYWRKQLAGMEVLELPADRPRPSVRSYRGANRGFTVERELADKLRALSRREGVTPFMTMLGVLDILMSRYSGQSDVVLGTDIANRNRAEIEGLIGFFANQLVLRIEVRKVETFSELLKRVREVCLGAYAHQDLPFEKLVEELQPERDLSRSPLFQVKLIWENAQGEANGPEKMRMFSFGSGDTGTAKFDLTVAVTDDGENLFGGVEYSLDLFEAETIGRLIGHYSNLLSGIAEESGRPIGSLSLLSDQEREQIVKEWNQTRRLYANDWRIHELFERQVEKTPEAVALIYENQQLSYAGLNARANQLGSHLRRLGAGPETLVGICMERSLEMVVGLFGILKSGGAYVPLDPAYPLDRLTYMLEESAPVAVLTHAPVQTQVRSALTRTFAPVIDLEADAGNWNNEPDANPDRASVSLTQGTSAYVIYTSGSTGRPKGVMNEHRGVVNRLLWMQDAYKLNQQDTILQKTPFSFDVSVWEFFWPLLNGARLVMARADGHKDPAYLADTIQRERITILHFVPSMLQAFLEHGEVAMCSSLAHVICSGEALPGSLARRFRERLKQVRLHNLYGPTEAAVDVTAWACATDTSQKAIPIGRPIANTQIYLLDGSGHPVPVGVGGEIHIGGTQVARGYLRSSELTGERFVPDPFISEPGARLYRTGDLARFQPGGEIEFLRRNDFQVKVRGFRIELGEIEARLASHPAIKEAVALAREDSPGDKRLVAYYTTADAVTPGPDAEALRGYLLESLPEYMAPAAYVKLDALPLTPNGKLDRRALPAPEDKAYVRRGYEPPVGGTEIKLAGIWADLLKLERVGRQDNFFELGGHSLLAISMIERMRRDGLPTEVRTLFAAPTLRALAEAIEGASPAEVKVPPNLIPAGCGRITPEMLPLVELKQPEIDTIVAGAPGGAPNVQDIYPLAPLQEGIFFHHLMNARGDAYLLHNLLAFDTRERLDSVLGALRQVIARHDILRTALVWEGLPEPVQVVWREAPLTVEEITLDPSEGEVADQLLARFDPRRIRLDLSQAPLMRCIVTTDAVRGRWLLLWLSHHLTTDHMALEVMIQEAQAALLGEIDRLPAPLPFRNLVAQARLSRERREDEEFFREMLGSVNEPTAPYGLLEVQGDGSEVEQARLELDATLAWRLKERSREMGVSAASVCHVAWGRVVGRVTGREDVVFGTVLFGRMGGGEGAERALGLFINTLPIRIGVGKESVERSVRRTQEALGGLMRREHASLAVAQRCSGVEAPTPLFSCLLNYRHSPREVKRSRVGSEAWVGMEMLESGERTNYPLTLSVDDLGDGFGLTVQAIRPIDAGRICEYMRKALEGVVEALEGAPERKVREIEVMPEAERRLVVEEWNATEAPYGKERLVHELFEEQVERSPEAVALIYEGQSLSYGELNRRANRLARHLRGLGVGPEVRVAICLERSLEMVVAMLATFKAGGAYVPLDPAYPSERLAYMLVDSAPLVLLTRGARSAALSAHAPGVCAVDLDIYAKQWDGHSEANPDRTGARLNAQCLAYILYTSGSTGLPKGVAIEHMSVVNFICWAKSAFDINALEQTLFSTSINFDLAVYECFVPLTVGATITVVGNALDLTRSPVEVTLINTVPSAMKSLVDTRVVPKSIRTVNLAGEALKQELVESIFAETAAETVCNLYGPSETTTYSTWVAMKRGKGFEPHIGQPIANTRIYILDRGLEPSPVRVAGEIHIGGAGEARGYLNRPEMTAERFLPDPFSRELGSRMYKTGDVGRWLSEGAIEFLGRNDNQVKIRGYRIELGEIEAKLSSHGGVREAVVVAREEEEVGKMLVAYYTGAEVGAEALREQLLSSLPEYMVPAAYVHLERLPLTPNGKLDRRALPAPNARNAGERVGYLAPQTPVEEIVVGIFEEVLKLDRVGRRDSFFELGGHSLLATQVISRVRKAFGVEVGVKRLFENATVEGLARAIEEAMRAGERAAAPPLARVSREGQRIVKLPPSFAQQRLWFLDQLVPNNPFYNCSGAVRLEGPLNLGALERAVIEIVRRHEVLRTRFEVEAGAPVQIIDQWEPRRLDVEDLTGLAPEERKLEVSRRASEEAAASFDLSRGPMFRVKVLKLGEEDHVLLYTMHHIVSDGWSMGILVGEVGKLYQAYSAGEESPLEELPIQYADYAEWQRQYLTDNVLEEHLAYWKRQLGGSLPTLGLPTDYPRPPVPSYRGATKSFSLPAELSRSLRALSRQEGVTPFMTLLAAFKTLLYRYTAQEDLIVGTVMAGRTRIETEPLIGFFVNAMPLRTDLCGDPGFRELLRRVKEVALGGYIHQDLPFEKLVEEIRPEVKAGEMPLFNITFGVQNAPQEDLHLNGIEIKPMALEQESARWDLTLWIKEGAEEMGVSWTYSKDLFEESTIRRMHRHFETLLFNISDRPDTRLTALEISFRSETGLDNKARSDREGPHIGKLMSIKRKGVNLPAKPVR